MTAAPSAGRKSGEPWDRQACNWVKYSPPSPEPNGRATFQAVTPQPMNRTKSEATNQMRRLGPNSEAGPAWLPAKGLELLLDPPMRLFLDLPLELRGAVMSRGGKSRDAVSRGDALRGGPPPDALPSERLLDESERGERGAGTPSITTQFATLQKARSPERHR